MIRFDHTRASIEHHTYFMILTFAFTHTAPPGDVRTVSWCVMRPLLERTQNAAEVFRIFLD